MEGQKGRDWKGGLYKPDDYKEGQRYPLVIQTHGFFESVFGPSGVFPTAFAARALAATGIIVLQSESLDDCPNCTPDEGPCAVAMLESAANQLVRMACGSGKNRHHRIQPHLLLRDGDAYD